MRTFIRKVSINVSRAQGSWLTLLLLLVVLVPSACLLWFMNQAVQNERLAVRQKLADAYRGHLALAQERVANYWKQTSDEIETLGKTVPPPLLFQQLVHEGRADAVICYDANGDVVYPDIVQSEKLGSPIAGFTEIRLLESSDPAAAAEAYAQFAQKATNVNSAARALQAQARCFAKAGKTAEAIAVLTGPLEDAKYRDATDAQGRLLVPSTELMALELLKNSASDKSIALKGRLEQRLRDYNDSVMSASQRRFLMHEMLKLYPDDSFPTLASEDLSSRYVESNETSPREATLRATSLPGIWQFASADGRVVTLHKTENLAFRLRAAVTSQSLPPDVQLDFVSPGSDAESALISTTAGPSLPGWRLTISLKDQRLFDSTTRERTTSYIWIGVLVVALVFVLGLLALGMIRRQAALTQLRNDLVANVTHELKTPLSSMRLFVETLLNSEKLDEKTAREYLQLIAKENVRLSRLIDNFLTFSRIERNKYSFDFKQVPAAKIAEGAAAAVHDRFNVPGCQFEVRIAANLPQVSADADAMVTALLNLLDNAYKYSGDTKQITFTADVKNGDVIFAVRDNGIGLSKSDAARVFKRFFQVHQHMSPVNGGCGLGLSIVQFVVSAHRGTVRVESEPERGSTFVVSIPAGSTQQSQESKS